MDEQSAAARFSPRLQNAVVADLVMDLERPQDEIDRLLMTRLRHDEEWTEHLARQLDLSGIHGIGDIHGTLVFMLPELDRMVREWPPPINDSKACDQLAHMATKALTNVECYATLLAGPDRWRRLPIESAGTIGNLGPCLHEILRRALSSSLNDMLARWVKWDIPKLSDRYREARARRDNQLADAHAAESSAAGEARRQQLRESRAERAKWRLGASYTPPGRRT